MADDQNPNQTIASFREGLEYNKPDDELLRAIDKAIKESKGLKADLDRIAEKNQKYWQYGTIQDYTKYHPKKCKTIVNRIFTDVETAIPILTSETPEPTILGNVDNNTKVTLQEGLTMAYDVKYKMQQKLQTLIRSWYMSRLGVWKYRWDKDYGFCTENVTTNNIGFDPRATNLYKDCEYVWEELEDTVENITAKFPAKAKDILAILGQEKAPKSKMKYTEFWGGGGQWVCWRLREIILDKKKNLNFDYENEQNNLFDKPRFPYIILNVFQIGKDTGLYDNTSLIEECIPIQDAVNQLEQQIIDLNEGRKRVWIASGEAISEKKCQELVNETGDLLVYMDRKGSKDALGQVQSGVPDAGMFNNLTHLLGEIDNIMGMHSTTRGERAQQETATGRQLLVGSDYGRLDLIVRNIEECAEDWFNAYLQMLKVYAIQPEVLSNGEQTIELSADNIPSTVKIMVTKGSTLPTDEKTKRDNAIELAQMGMIDPETLFEEMGYPNEAQRVQKLVQWLQMTGKIVPQQQMMGQPQDQGQGQGQPQGQDEQSKIQQLQRVQQLVQSPEFQQLAPDKRAEFIQRARQAVATVQGSQTQ